MNTHENNDQIFIIRVVVRILLHFNASLCMVHHQYMDYRRGAPFIQVNDCNVTFLKKSCMKPSLSMDTETAPSSLAFCLP